MIEGRGMTAGDVGNVPDENPIVSCNWCDRSERWSKIREAGTWLTSLDPEVPFLCPECCRQWVHDD